MREIIHVASRVGEGLADVSDEDADKHIKGHQEFILNDNGLEGPKDSFTEEEEIDADLAVWTWSLFPKHFSLHRQHRTKWRSVILSRLQIQIYPDKD